MTRAEIPAAPLGSLANRVWYEFVRRLLWLWCLVCFRIRCDGREHVPETGGVLLLANHQSMLDPPLMGMVVPRAANYVARETLFKNKLFAVLLRSFHAIPIDRDGLGIGGLKETLRRLKRGEIVLLFPEGTRTPDGEMQPLKPGFSALVKRTGACIVPVGIEGSYGAWPRSQPLPLPHVVQIEIGAPIPAAEAGALDERELITLVEARLHACHAEARRKRALRLGE
ncbi:MAG: 1-acyl-sn-glycerol-3-phosphate acyltransferase [Planctomycetia bacterium]|nr:1-acyl-sn-glycerol-3-phosphate acyltransferase [Planctomycetia bacterium]